jgi:hypothetical protein
MPKSALLPNLLLLASITVPFGVPVAEAQGNAPSTIAGQSAVAVISSGSGPFANIGGYRITFGTSTYSISPLSWTVNPSAGTYTYAKTGPNTAALSITDSSIGSAIVQNLVFSSPSTASYSISGFGGSQTGTIVIEGDSGLINLSVRGFVPNGWQAIPGFVIEGQRTRVLIRAAGPALAALGVNGTLANPKITVYRGSTPIGSNDDWSSTTANRNAVTEANLSTGAFAFATGSRDAALVMDLDPGAYTAHVSGDQGTSGEVLVEVYRVR